MIASSLANLELYFQEFLDCPETRAVIIKSENKRFAPTLRISTYLLKILSVGVLKIPCPLMSQYSFRSNIVCHSL